MSIHEAIEEHTEKCREILIDLLKKIFIPIPPMWSIITVCCVFVSTVVGSVVYYKVEVNNMSKEITRVDTTTEQNKEDIREIKVTLKELQDIKAITTETNLNIKALRDDLRRTR